MKRLLLLRHAKSSHGHSGLSDHDRPLNERGESEAPRVGSYLSTQGDGWTPDLIVASTACRAHRTAALVAESCGVDAERVLLDRRLYLATPREIIGVAQETPAATDTLLLVGHNPGMEELVSQLARQYIELKTAHAASFCWSGDDWSQTSWLTESEFEWEWRPKESVVDP